MNITILEGYLGSDTKVSDFDNSKVINCSISDSEKGYTTKAGRVIPDHVEWFKVRIICPSYNKLEDFIGKGTHVLVKGKTKTRSYTDKDGQEKKLTELIVLASDVVILGKARRSKSEDITETESSSDYENLPY